MAETKSPSNALQTAPPKPFLSRVMGVFIEPGETFEDIVRKPDWIAPLVLLVLVSLAFTETMLAKIGMGRIIMHSLQQSGRASRMDPEQLNQAIARGAHFAAIIAQVIGVVGVPIFLLVVAGFGMLVLNVFFGEKARFKAVFSVACYADLPTILGAVMGIAVMLFGDPEAFNPQSPAPTNLGFFLNSLTTTPRGHGVGEFAGFYHRLVPDPACDRAVASFAEKSRFRVHLYDLRRGVALGDYRQSGLRSAFRRW